jgi:hypothetical protein
VDCDIEYGVQNLLKEMSRYGVKPELLDSVAESFLALEKDGNSSGSDREEFKEEVNEILKDYKVKVEIKNK